MGTAWFLFLFTGVGLMLAALFQMVVGFSLMPQGTTLNNMGEAMLKAMNDPKNVNALRLMQVVSTLLMLALPPGLLCVCATANIGCG